MAFVARAIVWWKEIFASYAWYSHSVVQEHGFHDPLLLVWWNFCSSAIQCWQWSVHKIALCFNDVASNVSFPSLLSFESHITTRAKPNYFRKRKEFMLYWAMLSRYGLEHSLCFEQNDLLNHFLTWKRTFVSSKSNRPNVWSRSNSYLRNFHRFFSVNLSPSHITKDNWKFCDQTSYYFWKVLHTSKFVPHFQITSNMAKKFSLKKLLCLNFFLDWFVAFPFILLSSKHYYATYSLSFLCRVLMPEWTQSEYETIYRQFATAGCAGINRWRRVWWNLSAFLATKPQPILQKVLCRSRRFPLFWQRCHAVHDCLEGPWVENC